MTPMPPEVWKANTISTDGTTFTDPEHLPAPPASGWYRLGDHVWNSEPALGEPPGWVCTVSGNPGTWESFGEVTSVSTNLYDGGTASSSYDLDLEGGDSNEEYGGVMTLDSGGA